MGYGRVLIRFAFAALMFLPTPLAAVAAECTIAEMVRSAAAVIEPCTRLLNNARLSKAKRAEVLLIRGRGFHRSKRLPQASEDYEAAAALTPNNEEIWMSWSNLNLRRGDGQGYVEKLSRAAKLKPNNPRVLRSIGQMLWNFGDHRQAMEFFSKALRADPSEPYALLFRSQGHQSYKRFAQAIADANRLVALPRERINRDGYLDEHGDPRDFRVVALIHRGWLFEEVGQNDRAKRDFEAAVADGRTVHALVEAANFLQSQSDDPTKPAALFEEAVSKDPNNASAQFGLGMTMASSRQFEVAFTAFDRAVALRPGFSSALLMRARLHRQFGRTDDAVNDYLAMIETSPQSISDVMPALRHAGYWPSANTPAAVTPQLEDAIRACMLDISCN